MPVREDPPWSSRPIVPGGPSVWRIKLYHDGALIAAVTRTTNADGEATIDLRGVPDQAGPDQFSGKGRNLASGETCAGSSTL